MNNLAHELNEEERTELLDGRIIMMAPQRTNHQIYTNAAEYGNIGW